MLNPQPKLQCATTEEIKKQVTKSSDFENKFGYQPNDFDPRLLAVMNQRKAERKGGKQ